MVIKERAASTKWSQNYYNPTLINYGMHITKLRCETTLDEDLKTEIQ